MKKLTLKQAWVNCYKMWKSIGQYIADNEDGGNCDSEVWQLKTRWLWAHGFKDVDNACFFCEYSNLRAGCDNDCEHCPLGQGELGCERGAIWHEWNTKFANKIIHMFKRRYPNAKV
jgi:hypothetical protein